MLTLKSGDLAYYETVRDGLLPVRVLSIKQSRLGGHEVRAVVTARKPRVYKNGEIIESSSLHFHPRDAIRRTRYATYIRPSHKISDGGEHDQT